MKNISWFSLCLTVFISVLLSSAVSLQVSKEYLSKDKQFRVVDIKQLSEKLMKNLESTLKEQETELNPEMIKVIAQNEAKKMFTTIANTGGPNDIIIPKSSVIHVPPRYEITEEIAIKMGLEGVVEKNISQMMNDKSSD